MRFASKHVRQNCSNLRFLDTSYYDYAKGSHLCLNYYPKWSSLNTDISESYFLLAIKSNPVILTTLQAAKRGVKLFRKLHHYLIYLCGNSPVGEIIECKELQFKMCPVFVKIFICNEQSE